MKIYLAHPINGLTHEQVVDYYDSMHEAFEEMGYEVLCPMTAKGYFRNKKKERFVQSGYQFPVATNHAIFERDKWMVSQCDVFYCDLFEHQEFSIGCTMELAWASLLGKHTVLVLEKDSPYRHAFMLEAADIVFETPKEAINYFGYLITGSIE